MTFNQIFPLDASSQNNIHSQYATFGQIFITQQKYTNNPQRKEISNFRFNKLDGNFMDLQIFCFIKLIILLLIQLN